jgi:hypothetical protein
MSAGLLRPGPFPVDGPAAIGPAPATHAFRRGDRMIGSFIKRIWHVKGSVPLPPGQSGEQAFDRLDPLFQQYGTRHVRTGDRLTFDKKDPGAQDKFSVFEHGVLRIEPRGGGLTLDYHLVSRSLLFCFLVPFLFLAIAQATVAINRWNAPSDSPAAKAEAAKAEAKRKVTERRLSALPMNPIDKALGAPPPDKPGKSKKKSKQPTTTAAYILAGLFALLYIVGRFLEPFLIKRTIARSLANL